MLKIPTTTDLRSMRQRKRVTLDKATNDNVIEVMTAANRRQFNFGEGVGILAFEYWYDCISTPGHLLYAPTYDFPVRIKLVEDPFDPVGRRKSSIENCGMEHSAMDFSGSGT